MKSRIIKRMLAVTMAASLVAGLAVMAMATDAPKPVDPPKDPITQIEEQTSNIVAGTKSTTSEINLATNVEGFAVTTSKDEIAADLGLATGEKPLVKVSNFDAKKSTACKAVIDTVAESAGLSVGPIINYEAGKMVGKQYTALDEDAGTVDVKIGAYKFKNAKGVIRVTPTMSQILEDQDNDPFTVTIKLPAGKSTLALYK